MVKRSSLQVVVSSIRALPCGGSVIPKAETISGRLPQGTGQLIGFVALNEERHDGKPVFNLGYVFHFEYHGQGYASEACRAVLAHAFERLQAQRVVTGTAAAHRASYCLLERLGFQKIAESIGSFRTTHGCTHILARKQSAQHASR